MLDFFAESFFWLCAIGLACAYGLARGMLKYHVFVYGSPREQIADFLNALKFPLSFFYANTNSNVFLRYERVNPVEYLAGDINPIGALADVVFGYAASLCFLLIYVTRTASDINEPSTFMAHVLFILLDVLLIFRSILFGQSLKSGR